MGVLDFNPSAVNIDATGALAGIGTWLSMLVWVLIFLFGGMYFIKWMRYRIPITIFERVGSGLVQTKKTKAKEIIKDGVTKYEIRTLLGLIKKSKKEFYFNPDPEYRIMTRKGFSFNLLKLGFNAYNPIKINVYTNTWDKIWASFKTGIGRKAEFNPKKQHKEIQTEKEQYHYSYVPIKFDESPVNYEIIPQNLLPHLSRSLQENFEMFNTKKWWEPYMLPFSIFIFCALQIIVMGWMFDKVGGVGGACEAAESKITSVLSQRI